MRFAPVVSAAALILLAGAFTSVCVTPPAIAEASLSAPSGATAPAGPVLADLGPRPRGPGEPRLGHLEGDTGNATLLVIEGGRDRGGAPSRAVLWLALSMIAGVAMRIVIALVEGRWGLLLVLACTSLFISGLVVIGA